jgi:uncharacterized membrane protein YdbT with pleckstrin-like domain
LCFCLSSDRHVQHGIVVWLGKPWVAPAAIIRTVTVIILTVLFLGLEFYSGVSFLNLVGLPVFAWTILVFVVIWLLSMLGLVIFWASNTYVLRQDGLEIRRGIIRLHSFVVTPMGFGYLLVYQSLGGRIFGYGDITVNSQGERQTKLVLVRSPFAVADTIRDIMGKPLVRVETHA